MTLFRKWRDRRLIREMLANIRESYGDDPDGEFVVYCAESSIRQPWFNICPLHPLYKKRTDGIERLSVMHCHHWAFMPQKMRAWIYKTIEREFSKQESGQ